MRNILIILLLLGIKINAQNLISNGGFESLTEPVSFYDCDYSMKNLPNGGLAGDQHCFPFYHNKVPNWDSYSYSAEIVTNNVYPGLSGNFGVYSRITTTNTGLSTFYEGIFQMRDLIEINGNLTREKIFKLGKSYLVSLKYKFINGSLGTVNPSLKLMAGSFFKDRNLPGSLPRNNLNDINNDIIAITSNVLAEDQWHTFSVFYTPTSDKAGLAIVPVGLGGGVTSSTIIFDDVSVIESCCINNKTYNNVNNPPSVNAQDYVNCNSNVSFNSGSNTSLLAPNGITLANNTVIDGVNSFIAQAENCLTKPVEMYSSVNQAECDYNFKISACYGSGLFEYYFNDVIDFDGELIIPASQITASTMTFKIKDLATQLITTQTLNIPPKKYLGPYSIQSIGNSITPNNDGINDYFRVKDYNKTSFAYNANKYSIQIWDRWGNVWYEQLDKPAGSNGFSDTEIFWDGKNHNGVNNGACFPNGGTAYYLLKLKNCDNSKTVDLNGTITVLGCTNSLSKTSTLTEIVSKNNLIEISPNPTSSILNIGFFEEKVNITVFDMLGKQQNIEYKIQDNNNNGNLTYSLDCSNLNNGIYFCTINDRGNTETVKFTVMK